MPSQASHHKQPRDNLALAEDAARWALETWALALNKPSTVADGAQVYPTAIARECCGGTPAREADGDSLLTPSPVHSTLWAAIRAKSNSASIARDDL